VARKETIDMVQLDHALIHRSRQLLTGANVHRGRELIFVYEQAVLLHNEGSPNHIVYQSQHETALRAFVRQEALAHRGESQPELREAETPA